MKKIYLALAFVISCLFTFAQSDGTLDPSFDTDGILTADNGTESDDVANDMVLMEDKSIIVGGWSYINEPDFALFSFTSSGAFNTSFGTDGKLIFDIENGSQDYLNALAVDMNQRIIAVGYSIIGADEDIVVARITADGVVDTDFGTNGVVKLNISLKNVAYDVAIQPDNKIVIAGYVNDGLTPTKALIVRLNEDGSYDGAFGDNGVWEGSPDPTYDVYVYAVAIQNDGNIIIGGQHNVNGDDQFALGRILSGGSMDTNFDGDGWVTKNLSIGFPDIIHSVLIQPDDKILVAGETQGQIAVSRFNNDGTDDEAFANAGSFTDPLLANDDYLYSVTLQPDGKIVAAGGGSIDDNVDFLVIRLTEDGILDPTFNDDGVVYTNFNFNNDFAYKVLLEPDEKIIAAGTAINGYFIDFALAQYGTGATGIQTPEIIPDISVYPNPSSGEFNITFISSFVKGIAWKVTDLMGRIIISGKTAYNQNSLTVNTNAAEPGIYYLELKEETTGCILGKKKIVIE